MGSPGHEKTDNRSLHDFAAGRLAQLARALDFDEQGALAMFKRLSSPWAERSIGASPVWPSEVGDDRTPVEFSVALGRTRGEHELRMMVEPLGENPSLETNAAAALALIERLRGQVDIDQGRLRRIADLFWPAHPQGGFAAWIAAGLSAAGRWNFKIYLNPQASGVDRAPAVVEEALVRLGFGRSWPLVADNLLTRELDSLKYFALDLSADAKASRVEVYAKHFYPVVDQLERATAPSAQYIAGETSRFLKNAAPDVEGEFKSRGLFTSYSFVAGSGFPATATTHFPINGYASNDQSVYERLTSVLEEFELDARTYRRVIKAYANRSFEDGLGLHSYASFGRDASGPRLTVHIPVEAYRAGIVAAANLPEAPRELSQIIDLYQNKRPMTDHPFLRRLRREPVDLRKLWVVLHNCQAAISLNFARYLAQVTARVEDNRVRCILAEQLTEELGNGCWERARANLFCRMMDTMHPYAPAAMIDAVWAPGAGFDRRSAVIYNDPNAYVGLGAMIAGKIFGKQIHQFLATEFRRQDVVDTESLEWLTLDERPELDHAESSAELTTLIPEREYGAVVQGAMGMARAGYLFLDDLYSVCYGLPGEALKSAAE